MRAGRRACGGATAEDSGLEAAQEARPHFMSRSPRPRPLGTGHCGFVSLSTGSNDPWAGFEGHLRLLMRSGRRNCWHEWANDDFEHRQLSYEG
jgi:hypothetical protein